MLTSHRLIWVDSSASIQPGRSCSIPLDAVQEAILHSPLLWAAPRLCIRIRTDAAGHPMNSGTYNEQVTAIISRPWRLLRMPHGRGEGHMPLWKLWCAQVNVTCRGSITQLHGQLSSALSAGMAQGGVLARGQRTSMIEVNRPS